MIFHKEYITGVYEIIPETIRDKRGFFARSFSKKEFEKHGLETDIVEQNISYNKKAGTFRGMHYQEHPYEEVKIVSCVHGSIFDIVLDLRPNSPTYKKWKGKMITDWLHNSMYIPRGCAHGFQSLTDDAIVYYSISEPYSEEHSKTVSYKNFEITLPMPVTAISEKDNE